MLFQCRFTSRVWSKVKVWLDLHDVQPSDWEAFGSVKEWWEHGIHKRGGSRKAVVMLVTLISWEVWKKRNTRVFRNHASTSIMIVSKIKNEVSLWCLAGAKALCNIMPRE
jgi:hypothetical protein